MKTSPIILTAPLFAPFNAKVQIVNGGATSTLSNITTTIIGDGTIGTSGALAGNSNNPVVVA
jgi:hypothetical protein